MYNYNALSQTPDEEEHQITVTNAALRYIRTESLSIEGLSRIYNVSGNTISHWLCEAVAKNYIASTSMCQALIKKHLHEYESKHHIKNSSLRQMYQEAILARNLTISVGS